MKAIHNINDSGKCAVEGAFTEQNYKNWKQFTTKILLKNVKSKVLLLNKITKIESNSQLLKTGKIASVGCFYWTKLQKLKAIHNDVACVSLLLVVLLLNKITKIESNSQLLCIWSLIFEWCFYWTKLQKLKAIHNDITNKHNAEMGAFTEQNYKNWKQFTTWKHCF